MTHRRMQNKTTQFGIIFKTNGSRIEFGNSKTASVVKSRALFCAIYARIFLYIKWLNLPIFSTHWTLELSGYPTAQTFSEIRELVQ